MLVAAGYFNYSTFNSETQETYSEDINANTQEANIGDAVLVSNNEEENISQNMFENIQTSSQLSQEEENQTNNNIENNQIQEENDNDETNYYASSKLDRDKMYAEMISSYQEILNNTNCSEAQKSIATQEIAKINNTKNAIMICENLILTKREFQNCVILVNDNNVNVVVKIEGGVDTESVAKIQNIISREIGTQIENIHITEK